MNTEYPACAKIAEAIAAFPIETAQNGSLVECIPDRKSTRLNSSHMA